MLRRITRIAGWTVLIVVLLVAGLAAFLYVEGRPSRGTPQYVALGSSFASGPDITQRADNSPVFCGRSRDNYAQQLARLRGLSLVDATCGGATTAHVLEGGQLLQPAQLDALGPDTELVTITIGGNDIYYMGNLIAYGCDGQTSTFIRLVGACTPKPPAEIERLLAQLPLQLQRIAGEVSRRAPRARLVFVNYQAVLPTGGSCDGLGMNEADADRMRGVAAALAEVTRAAARASGADLFDAAAATQGHDVCASEPWMSDRLARVPLHTTLGGMTAIAQGLNRLLDAPR